MINIIPPPRITDKYGEGHYLASRGSRLHNGIDLACYKDSIILSASKGWVSKLGYPYNPNDEIKGHLRYVQITFDELDFRYFYVLPLVKVGDVVDIGDPIGTAQGLVDIYPGITDHVHVEIKRNGQFINPGDILP